MLYLIAGTLTESLLVLNALLSGRRFCELCGVDKKFYNAENFVRDRNLDFDREFDFKLYSVSGEEIFCEDFTRLLQEIQTFLLPTC